MQHVDIEQIHMQSFKIFFIYRVTFDVEINSEPLLDEIYTSGRSTPILQRAKKG